MMEISMEILAEIIVENTSFKKFTCSQEIILQIYHTKMGHDYMEWTYLAYINR
jgi:hypothetical protein